MCAYFVAIGVMAWVSNYIPWFCVVRIRYPCPKRMMYTKVKFRRICHGRDLWKLARSCKQLFYYARECREIYQLLPYSVDFKAPGELWNPQSKTVLNLKSNLYVGPVNIFPICFTLLYMCHLPPLATRVLRIDESSVWTTSTKTASVGSNLTLGGFSS